MEKTNWLTHIEMLILFLTLLGGFYSIDAKFDAKFDNINARFDTFLMTWHEESKDFHGRLCEMQIHEKK